MSSLDAVVILSPVLVVALPLVGDGSSVPGRSRVVPVAVLGCLLVLASVIASSCARLSGVGSACLPR